MLQLEFISNEQQFFDLASTWESLGDESATAFQFFQDWHWVSRWWKNLSPLGNYQLSVLIATLDDTVVMIWPWVVNRHYGLRILQPMGGLVSCFDDAMIIDTREKQDILEQAWEYILDQTNVDAIELRAVHERANIAPLIRAVGGEPVATTAAPAVDLSAYENYDAYLANRSKKMRQNQRRSLKYLSEQGDLRGSGDDQDIPIDSALDTCLSFKSQWLEARGLSGKTLVTDEALVFLKQVCNDYRKNIKGPNLKISSMYLNDNPIYLGIGFRYHNYHFEYLGSFDYQLERFGPGRLGMGYGLQDCFEKGVSGYDLLTPATPFKKIWTDNNPVVGHYIISTSVKGRLYRDVYVRKLRPQLKKAYNAMPSIFRTRLVKSGLWG